MKIGIDASPLTIPFPCGTKNYSVNLLKHLAKIDKKNEYFIFASKYVKIPGQANFHFIKTPSILPIFRRQFFLSHYVKKIKPDVFHYLNPFGDIFLKHPNIITTVHDVNLNHTYPYFSKYFPNRIICELTSGIIFKRTKLFITPSSVMKNELSKILEMKDIFSTVYDIPEGVSDIFKVHRVANKKSVNYFLSLSDFAERKNTKNIIIAYSGLPQEIKNKYQLKIISSTIKPAEKYRKIIKKMNLADNCKIYVNVSLNKLINLYGNAKCFIYPSKYEGFGLPILEEFASGCTVITSDYGAMKETAGDSALLINPDSPQEISNAIIKITENNRLYRALIEKGLKRANEFSWKNTAKSTLALYKKIMYQQKP